MSTETVPAVAGGFASGGVTDAGHSFSMAYSSALERLTEQTATDLLNLEARREGHRPPRELDVQAETQAALDILSLTREDLSRKIDEARQTELARLRPLAARAAAAKGKAVEALAAWKAAHTEDTCTGYRRSAPAERDRFCSTECTLKHRAWRRLVEAASPLGAALDQFTRLRIPHAAKMQETHARLADRTARARLADARERLAGHETAVERHNGRERPPAALLAKVKAARIEVSRLEHDAGAAGAAHREAVAHIELLERQALAALEPLTPPPATTPATPKPAAKAKRSA